MKTTLLVSFILSAALLSAEETRPTTGTTDSHSSKNPTNDVLTGYRVFHLGNSFTVNTQFHAEYFAKKAGWTNHTHLCAWSPGIMIGGSWGHWQKPEFSTKSEHGDHLCGWQRGLRDFAWDRILIQPFFEDQTNCITACNNFFDYARTNKSPNVQVIVKQIWFTRDVTSFEAGRQPNGVAYFEGIADGIQTAHPGATVYVCPSGLVIQELRRLTALGLMPGVAQEADWYADRIHLSKIGNYADGMTQFITLYRVDPRQYNLPANLEPKQWYGYTIAPETAAKIMEVAWNITRAYPRSGVLSGAAGGVAPVPASPQASTPSAAGPVVKKTNHPPTAAFTITPAKGQAPCVVTFDGSASSDPDPNDGIFGFDWDFGDSSEHSYEAHPNHTYGTAGIYTVSLIVLDNNGAFSPKVSKTVTVTLPSK